MYLFIKYRKLLINLNLTFYTSQYLTYGRPWFVCIHKLKLFFFTLKTNKSRTDPSDIKFNYIISQLNIHVVLLVLANEFVQGIYHLYFTLSLHRVQKNIILSERVYLSNMCKTNLKYLDNFFFCGLEKINQHLQ